MNQPPQPPNIARKVQIFPHQMIGVSLMVFFLLLSLFGVFGESTEKAADSSSRIALEVTYPSRSRYGLPVEIQVAVQNTSTQPIETLTLLLSRDYFDAFDDLHFFPSADRITDDAYEVDLENLQPEETRILTIGAKGGRYWQHKGDIRIEGESKVSLSTFIFP